MTPDLTDAIILVMHKNSVMSDEVEFNVSENLLTYVIFPVNESSLKMFSFLEYYLWQHIFCYIQHSACKRSRVMMYSESLDSLSSSPSSLEALDPLSSYPSSLEGFALIFLVSIIA